MVGLEDYNEIEILLHDLGNEDGIIRQKARHKLVAMGERALSPLLDVIKDNERLVHWEVIKTLSQIGGIKAVNSLITALEVDIFSIRWLAAEGLVTIGHDSVIPLLELLIEKSHSVLVIEGVHHVFNDLVNRELVSDFICELLIPVNEAFDHKDMEITVPFEAMKALDQLTPIH